jgi:hypothetical protein
LTARVQVIMWRDRMIVGVLFQAGSSKREIGLEWGKE